MEQAGKLLAQLKSDLLDPRLSDPEKQSLLDQLKVLGRIPANATPIFRIEGIEILAKYSFDSAAGPVSREAMRCLANALFLNEPARQVFLDLGYSGKAANRLKNDDRDDEFLATRILFFSTYTGKLDIDQLMQKHGLADSIIANLARHADLAGLESKQTEKVAASPITAMALQETLKMIPNLVYYDSKSMPQLTGSISPLLKLLQTQPISSSPLQPPISLIINALMNLELVPEKVEDESARGALSPPSDWYSLTQRLLDILDRATIAYPERELDQTASPLVTLLRKVYDAAPTKVQEDMRAKLLPSTEQRERPLGTDNSLPSRLLRLTISPMVPMLRESIATFLFELSDKDPEKLVQNIGYGYAAGYLTTHNIEVPPSAMGQGAGINDKKSVINPITGQRIDMEAEDELPPMTEEEKEREAERLFVLFERLRATGVMDVKNPVTQAKEEGRFEEVE